MVADSGRKQDEAAASAFRGSFVVRRGDDQDGTRWRGDVHGDLQQGWQHRVA